MTKKVVKLSVDEDVLDDAKNCIPNLSQFFTECLKYYLGKEEATYNIVKDEKILEEIGKLQVKLYMNKTKFNMEEELKKAEEFEKDKAWRFLWMKYEKTLMPEETLINNAIEATGLNRDTLEDMLDSLYSAINFEDLIIDTEYWSNIEKWYNKRNME